jgi:polysaccharide deacetylase family protein (PEP-CTERM system associated)
MILNALTFDVEDYFQVTGFAPHVHPETWDNYELRVDRSTQRILDRLAAADVHATFFILGWIARRCPRLVRSMAAAGHEVAAHGYWHRLVTTQSPGEFRNDVRNAKAALEDLIGEPVTAYRAPSFSITPDRCWAFDILNEEGYTVDSSVQKETFGIVESVRSAPFVIGNLCEYPLPMTRILGRRVPVGGGGYFRLWPYAWTRSALAAINADGRPFAVYLHPWEFDPDQPRIAVPWARRFKHYVNLHRTEPRFDRLLKDFHFGTMRDSLNALLGKSSKVVGPAMVS